MRGIAKEKNVTIYDIAKLSGYSPKTVSRVVNGGENVRKSTYDKIKKVLDEHNYVPNVYAKNLTNQTTKNILLSVRETRDFPLRWFYILLEKIIIECKKFNLNVIVEYFNEGDDIKKSILYTSSGFLSGVVLFYEFEDDQRIELLDRIKLPYLIFGKSQTEHINYVTNADYEAMVEVAKYTLSHDLKNMLMLIGDKSMVNLDRVNGVKSVYKDQGLDESLIEVETGLKTIQSVYEHTLNHIHKDNLPDVIFVSGDEKIIGLVRALSEMNIKVPDDVSVVGFDDIPLSAYMAPPLTTVAQDYDKLGEEIVKRLKGLINGEGNFQSVEVPTKLVIRESVKQLEG